jgi:hypothetical protein
MLKKSVGGSVSPFRRYTLQKLAKYSFQLGKRVGTYFVGLGFNEDSPNYHDNVEFSIMILLENHVTAGLSSV